jgi:hypothetical protein
MNARTGALANPGSDPAKQADVTDQAAAITSETLGKLRALPVPAGEKAAVQAIYSKVALIVTDAARLSSALRAGNQAAAQRANTTLEADAKAANEVSNAYGLTVCGS